MATICIIADDSMLQGTLGEFFERGGHRVLQARTAKEGVETAVRGAPDVVLLDLALPEEATSAVLSALRDANAVVLVLASGADERRALQALRLGAESLVSKPIDPDVLGLLAQRAMEKVRLRQMSHSLVRGRGSLPAHALLGSSPPMRELARQIELLARNDPSPVLVLGEPGTGKGRVAETLHALSPRGSGAFVGVSCVGLTASVLDAELFGGERGAGESGDRRVELLDAADGGSLFLDEIGALDSMLQPKLLEVLEGKRLRRQAGAKGTSVNLRLLVSTARDLVGEINEGRFREDLYYRISIMPVHLPPLRARAREDLLEIIRHVVDELRTQLPESPAELAEEARNNMLQYAWPGNIREMRNVLERSMMIARGESQIGVEHLPPELRRAAGPATHGHTPQSLAEVERQHIERTLLVHAQNRTRAARELGISRATLINKIRTYGLEQNTVTARGEFPRGGGKS